MKNIPDGNAPVFRKAQKLVEAEGCKVINPIDLDKLHDNFPARFAEDLMAICLRAKGIIVLPGWEMSQGATVEVATALRLGKPVWELGIFLLLSDDARHGPGSVKTTGIGSWLR